MEEVTDVAIISRSENVEDSPQASTNTQVFPALNYQRLLNAIGQILSSHENEGLSIDKQLQKLKMH